VLLLTIIKIYIHTQNRTKHLILTFKKVHEDVIMHQTILLHLISPSTGLFILLHLSGDL